MLTSAYTAEQVERYQTLPQKSTSSYLGAVAAAETSIGMLKKRDETSHQPRFGVVSL